MTGLKTSKVRYRREKLGLPQAPRFKSTRNALRRKNAAERAEWVISLGIFQAYRLGATQGSSIGEVILQAYEDYLADHQIRKESAGHAGDIGNSFPKLLQANIFYQSCIRMAEGCLYLDRCPCKKTYYVIDISDDENDMVPRGCPCNRLSGKGEVLGHKHLIQITEPKDKNGRKSVAAE